MPRFCANLTMLYTEHGFLYRFAAARADGFRGIEFMFPALVQNSVLWALAERGLSV